MIHTLAEASLSRTTNLIFPSNPQHYLKIGTLDLQIDQAEPGTQ